MNVANPKINVTKTDLARYLNDHSEAVKELISIRNQYMDKCNRARRIKVSQFGFWLRANKPAIFERIYKRLSKNPAILDAVYGQADSYA